MIYGIWQAELRSLQVKALIYILPSLPGHVR